MVECVLDDFARPQLGRLLERNFLLKPRRAHHARAVLVLVAFRPGHGIAHAVDESARGPGAVEGNGHRLIGNEPGLGRHDGAAGAALRQLVLGALPIVAVLDAGQNQQIHESFDKRRLARANRADDADVNAAAGSRGDVVKQVELLHAVSLLDLPGRGAPASTTVIHARPGLSPREKSGAG